MPKLSDRFDAGGVKVARAALGLNQLWTARVGFELAPQTQDLDIDAAIEDFVVVAAAQFKQLFPAQYPLRGSEEGNEQGEFGVGELDRFPVCRAEPSRTQVKLPSSETQSLQRFSLAAWDGMGLGSPQDRSDAGHQFARLNGLVR